MNMHACRNGTTNVSNNATAPTCVRVAMIYMVLMHKKEC